MAAITQIRNRHTDGRAYYDRKIAEGKTHKEALRCLKRRISDAIYARLRADARQAATEPGMKGPGGQPGNDSDSSAAGSHPAHRLFGQATPGPATTLRPAALCHACSAIEAKLKENPARALDSKEDSICVASCLIPANALIIHIRMFWCDDWTSGRSAGTRPSAAAAEENQHDSPTPARRYTAGHRASSPCSDRAVPPWEAALSCSQPGACPWTAGLSDGLLRG